MFRGPALRIQCHWPETPGRPRGLLATFDHYRPDRAGFGPAVPVRTALSAGWATLSVTTAANDWFLNADTPRALERLRRFCGKFAVVRAVGFSMGGYGALLFSGAMRTDAVLLFAPQGAVGPARAGWEWRWKAERARLPEGMDALDLHVAEGLRGVALFDPHATEADRRQARLVRKLAPGVGLVALPWAGHPPAATLAPPEGYRDLLLALLDGRLTPALVRARHRAMRAGVPAWRAAMARRGVSVEDQVAAGVPGWGGIEEAD